MRKELSEDKMKISILYLSTFFVFSQTAISAVNKNIKLNDVVKIVSEQNYNLKENAYKVYQAKENIEKARAELLPRLNLWNIVGVILDPTSLVDKISDAAPFLIPANWFRLEEIKILTLAEKEGYRALWGNEVFAAKALYRHTLYDQQLLLHIQQSIKDLEEILLVVKTKELFGGAKPGTARDVEVRILGLKEDEVNLKVLISLERDELSYALGYPAETNLRLSAIDIPKIESLKEIDKRTFEFKMLSTSPERRQFDHFLSVISQVKKEQQYNFWGVSSISRGVAGGVFDSLPISNGVGNSVQASEKIIDAQKEILKVQKRGVEETLKRQLKATVTIYNSDIKNYKNYQRRQILAKESKESIYRRLQLGENLDVLELVEASKNEIQAQTAIFTVWYRVINSRDKLNRLTFDGDYSKLPPVMSSLQGE